MNTLPIFRGYFRQLFPLSLTSSACVKSSCLLTISKNRRYRKCYMPLSKWMPWPSFGVTFGNFRPLVSVFIETYTITWNARYRQLVNTIMLMNTLAILRGTFGNFRPLSLTTSACVNLNINLPLITSNAHYSKYLNAFASFSQNRPPVNLKKASSCRHDVVNQIYNDLFNGVSSLQHYVFTWIFCALVKLPSLLSIILCFFYVWSTLVTFICMSNTLSIARLTFHSRSSTVFVVALRVDGRDLLCV